MQSVLLRGIRTTGLREDRKVLGRVSVFHKKGGPLAPKQGGSSMYSPVYGVEPDQVPGIELLVEHSVPLSDVHFGMRSRIRGPYGLILK